MQYWYYGWGVVLSSQLLTDHLVPHWETLEMWVSSRLCFIWTFTDWNYSNWSVWVCPQAIMNVPVDATKVYRSNCASSLQSSQFVLPATIRLLPLFTLSLVKNVCAYYVVVCCNMLTVIVTFIVHTACIYIEPKGFIWCTKSSNESSENFTFGLLNVQSISQTICSPYSFWTGWWRCFKIWETCIILYTTVIGKVMHLTAGCSIDWWWQADHYPSQVKTDRRKAD